MGLKEIQEMKERANEPKPVKKYVIPKVSKKRAAKMESDKVLAELDKAFYLEHWAACPHRCECCGVKLPKEPSNFMFHHILEKRNYPQFRHTHENILTTCLGCHSKIETNIDFVPYAKKRRQEVEKLLLND